MTMKPGVHWDKSIFSIFYRIVVVVMFFVMALILIFGVLGRMLGWSDAAAPIWAIEKYRNPPPRKNSVEKEKNVDNDRTESRVDIGSSKEKHMVRGRAVPLSPNLIPSFLFWFPRPP